jgi:hypothetical protein
MHWNSKTKQLTEVDGKNNVETYILCSQRTMKNDMQGFHCPSIFVIIELKLETFAQ